MHFKKLHLSFAAAAFLISLITYSLTVQPTVPFWDCGEFTAATVHQQVPHPPGAPLFLMVGKLFHLLPIGNPQDSGVRVNYLSVAASAVTVWLLYLTIVMVINAMRKKPIETLADAYMVFGSAFVGALALNFSDTFWFNGVESEVYASSSLFVQVVVYFMMRWYEESGKAGHERYLFVMAYLIGLSIGVHLLALLAIFSIVYLVYFRRFQVTTMSFVGASVVSVIAFILIYKFIVFWIPTMMAGNLPMRNEILEYAVQNEMWVRVLSVLIILASVVGIVYGYRNNVTWLSLTSTAFVLVLLGYTTYTHLLLRSQANPPMNENAPKTFASLLSYIGREQYGAAPLVLPRRYETRDAQKIQNYKKYGTWYEPTDVAVTKNDGTQISIPKVTKLNLKGELAYLWEYQIRQMYLRYFFWNFVGRSSDIQDSGSALFSSKEADTVNFNSGYKSMFPIRFFALPLLLGLVGVFLHFRTDWKMAWVYMVMFLMMGVIAAVAQNQQEPQPRERDYFYAGSFMVWCLWIGMGTYFLIQNARQRLNSNAVVAPILILVLLLVPGNMAWAGWKLHSRAGNYLPFDYSYNILQSCQKDAILFTNGDNDTFPVWYLQDVDGVRRDIRVVNLSLGNTLWYVDQLKNQEPWGAKKIPLSFSDESLRVDENNEKALTYGLEEAKRVRIDVDPEIMKQFTSDPALLQQSSMEFTFAGQQYGKYGGKTMYLIKVQDKLILDILRTTRFSRPLYFSITAGYPGSETFVGLTDYVRLEGMAYRICPVAQRSAITGIVVNEPIMEQCLMSTLGDDEFYTDQHYGFKLRNLNNPSVYYDEHHRNYLDSYRRIYLQYANHALQEKRDRKHAAAILDKLRATISPDQFPMSYIDLLNTAEFYVVCGEKDVARSFAQRVVDRTKAILANPELAAFENGARSREYDPSLFLCDASVILGDEAEATEALRLYVQRQGENPRAKFRRDAMSLKIKAAKGLIGEAIEEARALMMQYQADPTAGMMYMQELAKVIDDLRLQSGDTSAVPSM